MFKHFLLIAPLALVLAACGSSGNQNAPAAAPAGPATTPATAPVGPPAPVATASATDTTTAAAPSTVGAATAVTAGTSASAPTTTPSTDMSAAAQAAMAKAAQSFVDNGQWVEGKDYFVIEPQQPKVTDTPKIEVVEVFSWGCPACNAAHKIIDTLDSQLPPYATMAYLAAGFRPDENWTLYQRAWYAAKALGVAHKSYDAMFDATWKTGETATYNLATGRPNPRSKWPDIHDIAKFYSQYGVSPEQFVAVANSFAVNTQMKRADELVKDYKVPATPTIIINGRYGFDFVSVGGYAKGIKLAKYLIAKEAKRLTTEAANAP